MRRSIFDPSDHHKTFDLEKFEKIFTLDSWGYKNKALIFFKIYLYIKNIFESRTNLLYEKMGKNWPYEKFGSIEHLQINQKCKKMRMKMRIGHVLVT